MTVLAMQAAGCSIKLEGKLVTPLSLNNWLTNYGGINNDLTIDYDLLKNLDFKEELRTDRI